MNSVNLEERLKEINASFGKKILWLCLEQIKNFNDFQNRYLKIKGYIHKEFPKLKEFDAEAISYNISLQMKDYEYDFKDLLKRPSTAFSNPLVFIKDETRLKIFDLIVKSVPDYFEELNMLYPEYS